MDRGLDPADHLGVDRVEHEVVNRAAELGSHRPLARRGAEDHADRLLDVGDAVGEREHAALVGPERERDPDPIRSSCIAAGVIPG